MNLKIALQQQEGIKEARKRIKEDHSTRNLDLSELGLEWIPDEIIETIRFDGTFFGQQSTYSYS